MAGHGGEIRARQKLRAATRDLRTQDLPALLRQPFQGHPAAMRAVRHRPSAADEPDAADGRGGGRQRAAGRSLLARGADREAVDHYGYNALHWALREAFRDAKFARGPLAALYELLAPASIDVNTGERLVRIDRHLSEYFSSRRCGCSSSRASPTASGEPTAPSTRRPPSRRLAAPAGQHRPPGTQQAPAPVERPGAQRNQPRLRLQPGAVHAFHQGWYQFNPKLAVRRRVAGDEQWLPIYAALNLPLINEFSLPCRPMPAINPFWLKMKA
jgi:hypothetical protein